MCRVRFYNGAVNAILIYLSDMNCSIKSRIINYIFIQLYRRFYILPVLDKPANGRVLFLTDHTATLQWDPLMNHHLVCSFIHQIVNCSYSNTSLELTMINPDRVVVIENLQVSTKYSCYSSFFNKMGYSAKSDEILFWTKLGGNYLHLLFLKFARHYRLFIL